VHAFVTKPLDWFSIQLARLSVHSGNGTDDHVTATQLLLDQPDFFCDFVEAPHDLHFVGDRDFTFSSPLPTPWRENNVVHGRFFRCRARWRDKPAIVLLHGWNADTGYRVLFPYLARRLVRAGVNVAMIELPYHCQRKPRSSGAIRNFLSDDLARVVEATRQSIADTRAILAWVKAQGCPRAGLWGISLGGWLSGLVVCADARADFAVLMTPVSRMDRVIAELDFCKPLRRRLIGASVRLDRLNLVAHRPRPLPKDVLIIQSAHDLFAPAETIEELWHAWDEPEIWRVAHGHISILMSAPMMERTVNWVARHACSQT
jgi:dienelactone hydrolase